MLDILFFDEIGQLPAELFSAIEIIFRRIRKNNIFLEGVVIISTMDHTQLQPVKGRPFLLSTHVITCFKMVKLEACVRAARDKDFQRLQEITRMHFSCFDNDSDLLEEFKSLLRNVPTYVPNWSSPEITPETYRLYGRKIQEVLSGCEENEKISQNFQVIHIYCRKYLMSYLLSVK